MSTFVLLTITGLGLGAMYFLIASGLSLIYGLMGVLNFAHGAFLTVGAYASWWLSDRLAGTIESVLPRFLLASLFGLIVGGVLAVLVELVLIRPLYLRHIEQVLVTVGLSLALVALLQGIWGPTERIFEVPGWLYETTSVLGAEVPNDRFVEIGVAVAVLIGLLAFLRYTRYGLIIRAGVENRAMVTALGIDVRKAFTLVFALGGVAAALAGVLSGVYFGAIDPERGHVAADLRVHRRRDRRPRLDRRLGRRGRDRRADAAVRELLRVVRRRRPRGDPAARADAAHPSERARRQMAAGALRRAAGIVFALAVLVLLAVVPTLSWDTHGVFSSPLDSPGTLQLLGLCLIFGGRRADLRPALRATPACSRSATRSTSRSAST